MPPIATASLNGSHASQDSARAGVKRSAQASETNGSAADHYHAATSDEAMEAEANYAAHNYHPLPIVFARAEGCKVWDPEGREYLDFLSAYSAVNQGHCHPELVKALTEQASRLTLSSRAFYNDVFPRFAKLATEMFKYDMVLPMCTGAEAVETAIKIARKWGYKKKGIPQNEAMVFSVKENFHGRTVSLQYTGLGLASIAPPDEVQAAKIFSFRPSQCRLTQSRATTMAHTFRTLAAYVLRPSEC